MKRGQLSISFLRIVATLAVVWLHTCSTLVENRTIFSLTNGQVQFYNAFYHIMNWAVPVFFMITGVLLLDPQKEITLEKCIKKYCKRIFYPLCFWGVIFAALIIVAESSSLNLYIIPKAIQYVISGESFSHLWYLYTLIGIYLLLPIIKQYVNQCEKRNLEYLLAILFIMDFVFPFITNLTSIKIAFKISLTYPFFYLILGYYMWNYVENDMKNELKYVTLGIVAAGSIIGLTFYSVDYNYIAEYNSPLIVILGGSIFYGAKRIKIKKLSEKTKKRIWSIDRTCFGIYLVHPLFIQFTYRFMKLVPTNFSGYVIMTFAFWIMYVVAATVLVRCMRKIKFLSIFV